ncbi:unnamed protein product [Dibothriocephalus latus]|uniref:Uncharacterized protein n=1 Tax=Dibothriocephalus latus TaxID=60516 RepID=A0A3P7R3W4_DIBLA|nr:unnamed protein product [Dibothriocephalus latus]
MRRSSSTKSPSFPLGEKAVDVDMRTPSTSAVTATTTTTSAVPTPPPPPLPSDPRRRQSSSSSADPGAAATSGRPDHLKRKFEPPEKAEVRVVD